MGADVERLSSWVDVVEVELVDVRRAAAAADSTEPGETVGSVSMAPLQHVEPHVLVVVVGWDPGACHRGWMVPVTTDSER